MIDHHKANAVFSSLQVLRERGWRVAVHNDYTKDGKFYTFWLFTWSYGPYFAKGEGTEDYYALNQVMNEADKLEEHHRSMEKAFRD